MEKTGSFCALFLYSNVSASLPLINGLKDKGVDGKVVSSSAELIQSIVRLNADVIGISVNHPSATSILQVIKTNTQIPVIIFGENDKPETLRKIQSHPADFKINGTISTYNIWMKLSGMIKKKLETAAAAEAADKQAKPKEQAKHKTIVVKGPGAESKKKQSGSIINTAPKAKKIPGKKTGAIIQMGAKKDKPPGPAPLLTNKALLSKPKAAPVKFLKKKESAPVIKTPPLFFKKETPVMESASQVQIFKKESEPVKSSAPIVTKEELSSPQSSSQTVTMALDSVPISQAGTVVQTEVASAPADIGSVATMMAEPPSHHGQVQRSGHENQKDNKIIDLAPVIESVELGSVEYFNEEMKPITANISSDEKKKIKIKLKEAAQNSLYSVFQKIEGDSVPSFADVRRISVVPVENKNERGYILFCSKNGDYLPNEKISSFNLKVKEQINTPENTFKLENIFEIELSEFDLQTWATQQAEFFFTGKDSDTENTMMMCYIEKNTVYPFLKYIEETGMYKMDLSELSANVPVVFDAYIYFKKNRRSALYLRRGGSFSSRQLQRLQRRGFLSMLIKKEHVHDYLQFYISRSIQGDIAPSNLEKQKAS